MLRDGRVDLAFLHARTTTSRGSTPSCCWTQDQVAMLARGHRLADRAALVLADLDGEPFPRWPGSDVRGPEVRDPGQLLQLVALGQVVAVVPESARRHVRPDVVCVPVLDAPRTWSAGLARPDPVTRGGRVRPGQYRGRRGRARARGLPHLR